LRGEGLGNWQIVLKENDQKILTGSGSTVLIALYRFVGLLYLKVIFILLVSGQQRFCWKIKSGGDSDG